jgi:hypothetical protein
MKSKPSNDTLPKLPFRTWYPTKASQRPLVGMPLKLQVQPKSQLQLSM